MDYRSVLTLRSGLNLSRADLSPPNADDADASAQTSFDVDLAGAGVFINQSGLMGETLDVDPIKDQLARWTGFSTETRSTFEQYQGIFNGVGESVAEPSTFETTVMVPLDSPLSFSAGFEGQAECTNGTSCTSIASVANSAAFLFTVPEGFMIESESGYGYVSRLSPSTPSPVPEPAGVLLLGSGLVGLLALRRWR